MTWYHAGAVIDFDGPRYEHMSIKLRDVQLVDGIIVQIVSIVRVVQTNSQIGDLIRVIYAGASKIISVTSRKLQRHESSISMIFRDNSHKQFHYPAKTRCFTAT